MHIAGINNGPGQRFAAMIPAWQLFDPLHYSGVDDTEKWSMVKP
jgi:hypothetical protein